MRLIPREQKFFNMFADVAANLTEGDLGPSPDEVQDHLHQVAVYSADFDKLYVEVTSDGDIHNAR